MPATTSEGLVLWSAYNVKPSIVNDIVKNVNLNVAKISGENVKTSFCFDDGVTHFLKPHF